MRTASGFDAATQSSCDPTYLSLSRGGGFAARRNLPGQQRDGATHARARLVDDAARARGEVAAVAAHVSRYLSELRVSDRSVVGTRAHDPLQRRIPDRPRA